MGSTDRSPVELDALIVGAGFAGCYQLMKLRKLGYTVKLVDSAEDYGGVWWWHKYPGAVVDVPQPLYEFSDPAVWSAWRWKTRFPTDDQLRAYFQHVAKVWDLRRDTLFETFVDSATWDESASKWTVTTKNGHVFRAKFLSLNAGYAAKRYIPDWPGISDYKGTFIHPSHWPKDGLDLTGKRVAVIGVGSTGVQIISATAPIASQLTVFQRNINTANPMRQIEYKDGESPVPRDKYMELYSGRKDTYAGFDFDWYPKNTLDDTPEERQAVYQRLWDSGDFRYWIGNYKDMVFDPAANREAYNFWRDKTRARLRTERLKDLLAPMEPPYAFGCKRVSLETSYFDAFNRDNVELVDLRSNAIERVTERGLRTADGTEREFDVIICATGFDSVTGGLLQIDISGEDGRKLTEHWKSRTFTYLGMATAGFPNMMFTYGPQAPTALCNGAFCAELQGDYVASFMDHMREKGLKKAAVASHEVEKTYADTVAAVANMTLAPSVPSWYMGSNIPGKPKECLLWLGGVQAYIQMLENAKQNEWQGFKFD